MRFLLAALVAMEAEQSDRGALGCYIHTARTSSITSLHRQVSKAQEGGNFAS